MSSYIGPAPVLDCRALLAGLTTAPDGAANPWAGPHDSMLLTQSAVSLALIGRRHGGLWLPGLFCNGSLALCRAWGVPVRFYPVGPDLAPDWDWCRARVFAGPPSAFIVVHSFGRAIDCAPGRALADAAGWVLVEDAAHVLAPVAGIGETGDYVLFSPHKLLPLPHGAVLVARSAAADLSVARALPVARLGRAELSWLGKRALQRLTPGLPNWRHRLAGVAHADDPPAADIAPEPLQAAKPVARLLTALGPRLPDLLTERRHQVAAITTALAGDRRLRMVGDLAAPYRAVLRATDAPTAETLFQAWRRNGIAAESWPDLPPETMAAADLHAHAVDWRRRTILLPLPANWPAAALARRVAAALT